MPVTINDVAKAAGVSRATVVRALSDRYGTSEETKARIKKIASEMNYRPNYIARSLAVGTSKLIGLVIAPNLMPSITPTLETIEKSIRKAGYSMLFFFSADSKQAQKICLEQLMLNRAAGVIAAPSLHGGDPEPFQELIESGTKLVIIDRKIDGLEVPQIGCDGYQTGRLAVDHLISLGHRDIVHLGISGKSEGAAVRNKAFIDALTEAGIPVSASSIVETDFSEKAGAEVMAQILKRKKIPTAVVARHDVVAIGAMRAIYAAGLSVPKDISVVGNGNIPFSDMTRAPLTTVNNPMDQMATIGVKKLLDMLAGKKVAPEQIMLDTYLVIRESTAPPCR